MQENKPASNTKTQNEDQDNEDQDIDFRYRLQTQKTSEPWKVCKKVCKKVEGNITTFGRVAWMDSLDSLQSPSNGVAIWAWKKNGSTI